MFNFMDFGAPSMFPGSSGRHSTRNSRPAYRRADPFDIFGGYSEPSYYDPRQTVNSRSRPSYNNNYYHDDGADYYPQRTGQTIRNPRSSMHGAYGRPQYYQTMPGEEEYSYPVNASRQNTRQQQQHHQRQQPQRRQQPQASSQQESSFWDQFTADPFSAGPQTNMNESTPLKTTRNSANSGKFCNKNTDAGENQNPNVTTKTQKKSPEGQTSSKKTFIDNSQQLPKKIVIDAGLTPKNKKDIVIIEDVTPAQPKKSPADEPSRGLIIEEVNPSQV